MPTALLLSLLFGVEAGPPPPPEAQGETRGLEGDVFAGAFSGRGGALPRRNATPKEQWQQWNWKLGHLATDKEWETWQKSRQKPSARELQFVDDAINRHREESGQREEEIRRGAEFRRYMMRAQTEA